VAIEAGYTGKILRADLSSGRITWVPTLYYADRFIGGRGIAAKVYWDEVPPDVRPFDAENRLIFATGPLAGFTGLAGSRLQICGKSPATYPEMFCYASMGGSWGAELKFSGCDGIVIQGKSDKPVYLLLQDCVGEIRDASALWGKNSVETRESLKKEIGSSVKVLATGIAGENMVPFATVLADDDAAGAGGFAAVMGSKKLKAIVVRGSEKVIPANPEKLRALTEYVRKLAKDRRITPPTLMEPPFPPTMKRRACYGCIAGCLRAVFEASNGDKGKFMCQQSGVYIDAALRYYKGWTEVPFYASRLCDKYGLDTMVLAPLIKWLCRCGQAGILTDEKAGIPISKVGSLEFIESLIKKISLREGFGDILAQGILKAADSLGGSAKELIGDLIFPRTGEEWVYDPRMFITPGIFYAMEPKRPIQHLHEISWLIAQWVAWKKGIENAYVSTDVVRWVAKRFWGSEVASDFSTYEGKALAAKKIQDRQYVKECLILCDYAWPIAHVKYSEDHLGDSAIESKIFSAVVGKEVDEEGLYRMGERVFNLQRAILVREGHHGKEADRLPEFSYGIPLEYTEHNPECLLPGEGGKVITRKGAVVDKNKFESMRGEYYRYRGWDVTTGLQTFSALKQLQLEDVAEDLARRGLVVNVK
jgi:aldehyde:ferredoxin oxidoreductase